MNSYDLWFQKCVYLIVQFYGLLEYMHHNSLHILYTHV